MNIVNRFRRRKKIPDKSIKKVNVNANYANRKIPYQRKSVKRRLPNKLKENHAPIYDNMLNIPAAIYVKDASEKEVKNLRAWVTSQGFNEITEYSDSESVMTRSKGKGFRRLFQDSEQHKFSSVFIISLENIGFVNPLNFLLLILGLKVKGVRLISQAEPWTDMSIEDMQILYLTYCLHDDEISDMSIHSRSEKLRRKRKYNKMDSNDGGAS